MVEAFGTHVCNEELGSQALDQKASSHLYRRFLGSYFLTTFRARSLTQAAFAIEQGH